MNSKLFSRSLRPILIQTRLFSSTKIQFNQLPRFQTKLFINNEFVNSKSGKTFPTLNPANGKVLAQVQEADKEDVDIAQKAARKAFQTWRLSSASTRSRLMFKLADLIEKNADELALLDSLDNGKPVKMARNVDLPLTIECFRYYAGWCDKLEGSTIPIEGPYFAYTRPEPVGVVGQIIPWNFPLLMAAWKLGPALACGNTVILKPAEQTPLSALRLAELIREAGYPEGVVNILPGYGETAGAAIAEHMDIDKVAFTGSVEIGKLIMQAAGRSNLKRVSLELGGKSPLIVFADSDVNFAVDVAANGIFFNQGEVCTASSRVFVQEKIYDEFVQKSKERAKKVVVAEGTNPDAFHGPLVDETQMKKVLSYIESGKKEGAQLVTGGQRKGSEGFFVEPTIFANVKDEMKIAQEEIFGPVLSIIKFKDMDEVIKRANKTIYGLASAVITNDITKAFTIAHNIRAGTVWINCFNTFSSYVPFGGFKQSGIGRELGKQALNLYTENKSVIMRLDPYKGNIQ